MELNQDFISLYANVSCHASEAIAKLSLQPLLNQWFQIEIKAISAALIKIIYSFSDNSIKILPGRGIYIFNATSSHKTNS